MCDLTTYFEESQTLFLEGQVSNLTFPAWATEAYFETYEQRLLLPIIAPESQGKDSNQDIYDSCRLAALIYFRGLVGGVPFNHLVNKSLLGKLRNAVERTVPGRWDRAPGTLLWVLLIGTAASRNNKESRSFAGRLSVTSCCITVWHYQDLRKILVKFLRIEKLVVGRFRKRREAKGKRSLGFF